MIRVALIPSFEPDETLITLSEQLREQDFKIVIVDDGSGPAYTDIFDECEIFGDVLSYDTNRGKGFALREGLKYIKAIYGNCIIVTMDSDGQHMVCDAQKLCNRVETNPRQFVLGSRRLPKDAPTKSKWGNGITRFVYKTLTGTNVYDTQSGLRAFHSDWIPRLLEIRGDRYEYEMNVLLEISRQKLPIEEIPIHVIYFDKQNSVSHFDALHDSVRIYKEILKFAGSSLASFAIDYLMYALLLTLLGAGDAALLIANFGARAVSSIFNFTVNKKVVFKTQGNLKKESAKYFGLVLFNISINTLILTGLTTLGINAYGAKIAVECVMFILSYVIQHNFVFGKGNMKAGKEIECENISIQ